MGDTVVAELATVVPVPLTVDATVGAYASDVAARTESSAAPEIGGDTARCTEETDSNTNGALYNWEGAPNRGPCTETFTGLA